MLHITPLNFVEALLPHTYFPRTETRILKQKFNLVSVNMGDYCAKLGVMMVRLSHSMNYQGDKTFICQIRLQPDQFPDLCAAT